MYIMIPGRHHLLTNFQFQYLYRLVHNHLRGEKDVDGKTLPAKKVSGIIFAVTSANHEGTRRNPLSYARRAMAIQDFSHDLPVPVYCFSVKDTGLRDDFSEYTIKTINHQAEDIFELKPSNCIIACSTPVAAMYRRAGFQVFGAENTRPENPLAIAPWSVIEKIAANDDWEKDAEVLEAIHPASHRLLSRYRLGKTISFLFSDPIVGEDGDITETRDYAGYVRQMDEIANIKWKDVRCFVQSGRIGDIGCATGSWLKHAASAPELAESDFFGIEITRQLFQICQQRKDNNEFANPNIWFSQKNAVTGLVFKRNSMNTVYTGSLTHEIESYGSRKDLLGFIKNRFRELIPGGIWINRDVVGPEEGNRKVLMLLKDNNGSDKEDNLQSDAFHDFDNRAKLKAHLNKLSTLALFRRFASDFRKNEDGLIQYEETKIDGQTYIRTTLEQAAEFMLTKDYTDNWQSEMHERFCFWSFSDWKTALGEAGFEIAAGSHAYTNTWIAENRFAGKTALYSEKFELLPWPPTNMIMIARKPV